MEEMDAAKMLGGLAIGAAVMAFMKFGPGTSAEKPVEEEVKKAPAKKKKQKGPKAPSTFVPQKLVAIEATPEQKTTASEASKKKKKKKKTSDGTAAAKAKAEAEAKKAEAEAAAAAKAAKKAAKKKKKGKKTIVDDTPLPVADAPLPVVSDADYSTSNGFGNVETEVENGWNVVSKPKNNRAKKKKEAAPVAVEGGEAADVPTGTSASVVLSSQDLASVIGKGGKNIQQIQSQSGANLNIPKEGEGSSRTCVITGTEEQVAIAKELVLEYQQYRGPKPETITTIPVTHRDIMLLLANGGANIKNFRAQYETQLDISRREGNGVEEVTISGAREEVMKTVSALRNFFAAHSAEKLIPLETDRIVQAVYGPSGNRRKEIQDKTGARLDIDKMEKVVNVTGTKEQIQQAELMLIQTMKDERGPPKVGAGEIYEMVEIGGATGQIVGAGGKTINALQERTGASIDIKDDNTCYVFGTPEAVEVCAKEVKDIVNKYNENISKAQSTTSSYEVDGTQGDWNLPPVEDKWVPGISAIPQDGGSDGWGNGAQTPPGWVQ